MSDQTTGGGLSDYDVVGGGPTDGSDLSMRRRLPPQSGDQRTAPSIPVSTSTASARVRWRN